MDFDTAIKKINSLLRFGSMPGLERIQLLLNRINNPERRCKYIHIAGTNGKGSVCTMLSEMLQKSGFRTGLFTSPYIVDFCERIQINGEMISKASVAEIAEDVFPIIENMNASGKIITEFECITAIAFEYFAREKCDIVVLETGLGGRFDATNVILSPIASVITSISLDHTAVLGDTIEKIAGEKAGIIKKGCSTVFCPEQEESSRVITRTAKQLENRIYTVDRDQCKILSESISGSEFEYKGTNYFIRLAGRHQIKNACTAIEAAAPLRASGFNIPNSAIQEGLRSAFIPARLEVLKKEPLIILDGGHNPSGLESLADAVKKFLCGKKIFCIMSMLRDKAVSEAMAYIGGLFEKVYIVDIDNPRKLPADELKSTAEKYFNDVEICLDKKQAVNKAVDNAKLADGAVLVCGSLYLASEIRKIILDEASQ